MKYYSKAEGITIYTSSNDSCMFLWKKYHEKRSQTFDFMFVYCTVSPIGKNGEHWQNMSEK